MQFIDIKTAKETFNKSESTFRNIVREWRSGKHKNQVKEEGNKIFISVSFLQKRFGDQPTSTHSQKITSSDMLAIQIMQNQMDELNKSVERLQILLAQAQEQNSQLQKLLPQPASSKKPWYKFK